MSDILYECGCWEESTRHMALSLRDPQPMPERSAFGDSGFWLTHFCVEHWEKRKALERRCWEHYNMTDTEKWLKDNKVPSYATGRTVRAAKITHIGERDLDKYTRVWIITVDVDGKPVEYQTAAHFIHGHSPVEGGYLVFEPVRDSEPMVSYRKADEFEADFQPVKVSK